MAAKTAAERMREQFKNSVLDRVDNLMKGRRQLLAPFPIPAEDIYRLCFTDVQLEALEVLADRPDILRTTRQVYIANIPRELSAYQPEGSVLRACVKLENPRPGEVMISIDIAHLPTPMRSSIAEWVKHWTQCELERKRMWLRLHRLGEQCSTWGQVYRIWPDLISFMDEHHAKRIQQAKAKSPLPPMMDRWGPEQVNEGIHPEWLPEAFAPFTTLLAECLMLPPPEGPEVGSIA